MRSQTIKFMEVLTKARLVVFDLDYTLVRVREQHISQYINLTQAMLGLPQLTHDNAMLVWNEYYKEDQLRHITGFTGTTKEYYDRYWTVDSAILRGQNTDVYPGASEMVNGLINLGIRAHVLTGTSADVAHAQAEVLAVPNLPILALGGNPRFPGMNKPHPAGLVEVMDHHHSLPLETVMVGDSLSDAQAAKNAGTHFLYFNSRSLCHETAAIADATITDWNVILPLGRSQMPLRSA